jgi:hypothetical protein
VTRDLFEASKIQEVIVRDSGGQSAADFFDNIDPLRTLAMRHTSKSMMTLVRNRPCEVILSGDKRVWLLGRRLVAFLTS